MPVGQTVTQTRALSEERFRKFVGSANVTSDMGTPMNSNAAKETKIVSKGVERKDSVLVAKPIRKTTKPETQRLTIQDDFDINHQGLFISPLGVWSWSSCCFTQFCDAVSVSSQGDSPRVW